MRKLKIGDKEYSVPESWEDMTMGQYVKAFYELSSGSTDADVMKNESVIYSRILGESDDFLLSQPIDVFYRVQAALSFIFDMDGILETDCFSIVINGRKYFMPQPSEFSLRQYIDADMVMRQDDSNEKFIELLSILLLPIGKDGKLEEYKGVDVELKASIRSMSARDGLPFIFTFLKKKGLLNLITLMSSVDQDQETSVPR